MANKVATEKQARTGYVGLKEMVGEVVNQTFILLINSCLEPAFNFVGSSGNDKDLPNCFNIYMKKLANVAVFILFIIKQSNANLSD